MAVVLPSLRQGSEALTALDLPASVDVMVIGAGNARHSRNPRCAHDEGNEIPTDPDRVRLTIADPKTKVDA